MKKLLICLVTMVCLMGTVGVAYGNSGQATIPGFIARYTSSASVERSVIRVSNITGEPIDVTIVLYTSDGSLFKASGNINQIYNLNNVNENPTDATISFTLNANATGWISLGKSTANTNFGYGIIQWNQASKVVNGLIAYAYGIYYNSDGGYDRLLMPINNCLPF